MNNYVNWFSTVLHSIHMQGKGAGVRVKKTKGTEIELIRVDSGYVWKKFAKLEVTKFLYREQKKLNFPKIMSKVLV